jgi:gliding motility-associated lipoprotein GldH
MYYNRVIFVEMKSPFALLLVFCCCHWMACSPPSGVYEKDIALPGQQWQGNFHPSFDFDIRDDDTSYRYNVYLILRHTDAYNYNNIWIRGTVKQPGDSAVRSERYDLLLATNDKGWLGSGMDDIYEHRVQIQQDTKFSHPGRYSFTLEQIMREDPLKHVLNVGVRIEKVP